MYKKYSNHNLDFEFEFTKNNGMKKSLSKQTKTQGNFQNFAKMLTCFDEVISNAELIECHSNRYGSTNKKGKEEYIKAVYVMLSSMEYNNEIIPIELVVKERSVDNHKLYVSVSLGEIKNEEYITGGPPLNKSASSQPSIPLTISITDLISKINPKDGEFIKYVPDGMLDELQLESKKKALEAEKQYVESLKVEKKLSLKETSDIRDFDIDTKKEESILSGAFERIRGQRVDDITVRQVAERLLKEYESEYPQGTFRDNIEKMFNYIQRNENVSYRDMLHIMSEIAKPVIEKSLNVDNTAEESYKKLSKYLRKKLF